ncbi:DUF6791 domain-containing protein [Parasediminibacterium sp. JCM 36343]|uniref:DUF6791 domain-containing protein n=1 Tax=Parasediminibacterium sp. JCM 36343 TaxID=3374279 RepID=UPI003979B27D
MQQQLINLNPDLKRLLDEGYEMEVIGGRYLLVHHIPYLNPAKDVKYGTLVNILTLVTPSIVGKPQDHTIYFCGETPCDIEGNALSRVINSNTKQQLTESIVADFYFSSKPSIGYYDNHYEKIRTYSEILSSQARALDSSVTYKPRLKID